MLLTIDIGNTNIVFAVFKENNIKVKWRFATDHKRTSDEYASVIKTHLVLHNIDYSDIDNVIISSVVPQALFEVKNFCHDYIGLSAKIVGEESVKLPIEIQVDNPEEVGADRLVNAIGAVSIYKKPLIIVDFGTATTFDVIDENINYVGGVISPGVNLSLSALHKAAAKLPEVEIKQPKNIIGKSTISAMQSGFYFGYKGMIEKIINEIKDDLKKDFYVVATGGLGRFFADSTCSIDEYQQDLTIKGLLKIFEYNLS